MENPKNHYSRTTSLMKVVEEGSLKRTKRMKRRLRRKGSEKGNTLNMEPLSPDLAL